MKTLYCDSKGDKRFSALYAKVHLKTGEYLSIETFYQSVKRKADGSPCKKGEPVAYIVVYGKAYPASRLTELYNQLWEMYFSENPALLDFACEHTHFVDRFAGKAINTQAKAIASIVRQAKGLGFPEPLFRKEVN